MSFDRALRCRECGREYPLRALFSCEFCFGPLEVVYDYEAMAKAVTRQSIEAGPYSVWRYKDLLPVEGEPVDLNAGFTPLIRAENLGKRLGLNNLWLKNDCANPTWSFKDRVVAVASTKAREMGFKTLASASTGNLANAVSAHAARAGMEAFVFVPSDLEAGKLPTRLALTFDDRISFVLTEKLEIKRLDFLDVVRDQVGVTVGDAVVRLEHGHDLAVFCQTALSHQVGPCAERLAGLGFEFLDHCGCRGIGQSHPFPLDSFMISSVRAPHDSDRAASA